MVQLPGVARALVAVASIVVAVATAMTAAPTTLLMLRIELLGPMISRSVEIQNKASVASRALAILHSAGGPDHSVYY
jgi:hypothetical protein